MRFAIAAALALITASSLHAQDLSYSVPLAGKWNYAPATGGSEATFVDAYSRPQLWVRCTRATRRISISKLASAAAPTLNIWTSSLTRNLPATFTAATAHLTIDIGANDPLLDAMATSRGRIGVSAAGQPALVVPPWAEIGRVIEDCRV